jgi:hypothetical protein
MTRKPSWKGSISPRDIPNMADLLCIVEPRGLGAVTVLANAHGRDAVNRVFPVTRISWESNASGMPLDWLQPALASSGGHELPRALAFLIAIGVRNQGARAAVWDEGAEVPFRVFVPSGEH